MSSSERARKLQADARLAQLVEHLICNQGVGGSSPSAGTTLSMTYQYLPSLVFELGGISASAQIS